MFDTLLTFAYSVASVLVVAAYIPQIWALIKCKDKKEAQGFSVEAFGLWAATSMVVVTYVAKNSGDALMILYAFACAVNNIIMFGLIVYNRYWRFNGHTLSENVTTAITGAAHVTGVAAGNAAGVMSEVMPDAVVDAAGTVTGVVTDAAISVKDAVTVAAESMSEAVPAVVTANATSDMMGSEK